VCGDAAVRMLGFDGPTPRDAVTVEQLAERVLTRIRVSAPIASMPGVTLDLDTMAEALQDRQDVLAHSNTAVQSSRRNVQIARARRDEAWTTYTMEKNCAVSRLDGLLRAVGLGDIADGLLPARSRVSVETTASEKKEPVEKSATKDGSKASEGVKNSASVEKNPAVPEHDKPLLAINTRPSVPAPPS
jgi:hypothetical protein